MRYDKMNNEEKDNNDKERERVIKTVKELITEYKDLLDYLSEH